MNNSYFDGSTIEYILYELVIALATALTFGIATPWLLVWFYKWEVSHTVVEGQRMEFTGSGTSLVMNWFKWLLLTIITFGIYGLFIPVRVRQWRATHTTFKRII